jgi:hypothetical protein
MLFVTFHGGSSKGAVNNVNAYETGHGPQAKPSNSKVLIVPNPDQLSELRAMVLAGGYL